MYLIYFWVYACPDDGLQLDQDSGEFRQENVKTQSAAVGHDHLPLTRRRSRRFVRFPGLYSYILVAICDIS